MSSTNFVTEVVAATFTGDVVGDVTGDITGDITGAVTGNVTGNLTGNVTGNVTGDLTGDVTGDLTGQTFGAVSSYTADGAIAVTDKIALLDASGASTVMTLADGTVGQIIYIKASNVINAVSVAPANFADGTTLTFNTQFESAILAFAAAAWHIVATDGGAVT